MDNIKVLFLDRDGTITEESEEGDKIDSPDKIKFLPHVIYSLKNLYKRGFRFIMVTNQPGLGTVDFPKNEFERVQQKIIEVLKKNGVIFDLIGVCPHRKDDGCKCRKPKTGLVDEYIKANKINLDKSYMIGNNLSDMELGKNIGCRLIFIGENQYPKAILTTTSWKEILKTILLDE